MGCASFTPTIGCFLLLVLGAYGLAGLVFNIKELASPKDPSPGGRWPLNQRAALGCLACAQAGLILATIFGITATLKKSILIFYGSAFTLLIVFAFLTIVGGVCVRDARTDLPQLIFFSLRNGSTEYFKWISYVQWEHNCCGIHSFMDWGEFDLPTNILPKRSVPNSCCKRTMRVPKENCGKEILVPSKHVYEIHRRINPDGCGDKLTQAYKESLIYSGIEMFVIGFISLCVAAYVYIGVTRIIYVDFNNVAHQNPNSGGDGVNNQGSLANNGQGGPCDCNGVVCVDANGNAGGIPGLGPNFRPSQLFKQKRNEIGGNSQNNNNPNPTNSRGVRAQYMKINPGQRVVERFHQQKIKNVRQSTAYPCPVLTLPPLREFDFEDNCGSPNSNMKNVEMLYYPPDRVSCISTTPNSSFIQEGQFDAGVMGDSKSNLATAAAAARNIFTHHSSLPQVPQLNFRVPKQLNAPLKLKVPNPTTTSNGPGSGSIPATFSAAKIATTTMTTMTGAIVEEQQQNEGTNNFLNVLGQVGIAATAAAATNRLDPIAEESRNRLRSQDSVLSRGGSHSDQMPEAGAGAMCQIPEVNENEETGINQIEKIFLKIEEEIASATATAETETPEECSGAYGIGPLENLGATGIHPLELGARAGCLAEIFENEDKPNFDLDLPLGDSSRIFVHES